MNVMILNGKLHTNKREREKERETDRQRETERGRDRDNRDRDRERASFEKKPQLQMDPSTKVVFHVTN